MMKKIFVISLFAILFMQACKKDQQLVDGKKPEENVSEALEKYRNELINTPNGWIAYLYTNEIGGGYSFYLDFKKDNVLSLKADYISGSSQSTYRVKQVMAPSIIFDTYNSLHLLSDPDPSKFGGETGVGYGSDFEFEIRSQVGDTIKLVGKKRQTEFILVKATAADKAFYTNGDLEELQTYLKANPNLYILDEKDNTKKMQVTVNTDVSSRQVSLAVENNGAISSANASFSFSPSGLLNKTLTFGGNVFTHFTWDKANKKLFWLTSTGKKFEVFVSDKPIIPLHYLMGTVSSSISIPGTTTLPGSGQTFITAYNLMRSRITAGFSVPTIGRDLSFSFNDANKTFTVSLIVVQNGTNAFAANYTYSYTKSASGEYKFTGPPVVGGGAGAAIQSIMNAFILTRLTAQTFTLEYYVDAANGRTLGNMISKDQPSFNMTGLIQ